MNKSFAMKSVVILLLTVTTACSTMPEDDPYARTKRGAAIGAAVGAAAGYFLVGDGELDEVLGSAAVGAGLGAGIGLYMDKQQRALEDIAEVEVERIDQETLRVNFDSDILFAVNSSVLSSSSRVSLDEFSLVMRDFPKTAILIQGYTDSSGSEQYNLDLSQRRAGAVYNHLTLREIDESRMRAIGYGEGYPLADNRTPAGREQNRRVSILVKGKA